MKNILTYIDAFGHLTFHEKPFNELDALIFAELSYLDFKPLIPFTIGIGGTYLTSIADRLIDHNTLKFSGIMDTSYRQLPSLIARLKATRRFGKAWVSGYVNLVIEKEAQQFSAITLTINDHVHVIAFRGTDSTLAGWKEDAALSFQKRIPSHFHALRYLRLASHALAGRLILTGHSKGGHLAVHALSFTRSMIRNRVEGVYTFDAPGVHPDDVVEPSYRSSVHKIHSYIPHESVIGLLLEPTPNTTILQSSQVGLMQHDAFSWKVDEDHFQLEPSLTNQALDFREDLRAWLYDLEEHQREDFFELVFKLLYASKAKTLRELSRQFPFSVLEMLKGYQQLTQEEKKKLTKPIERFFKGGQWVRKLSLLAHLYPRIRNEK